MKQVLVLVAFSLFSCRSVPSDTAGEASALDSNLEVAEQAEPSPSVLDPKLNARFLGEDVDVPRFVGTFEGESREIAVHHQAIVDALLIDVGTTVADVGAGTGLFLESLSKAVGPSGQVMALDVSDAFVDHMTERVKKNGLENVEVRLSELRSANLEPNSVDLAFVCDVYHHFDHPQDMLASLASGIRPGGRLAVVDFHRIPGVSTEWILGHVRASKEVFVQEIIDAGFVPIEDIDLPGLEENYIVVFRLPQ